MRFAVEDTVALLDDGQADGLGQVTLAGARGAEKESVLVLGDEPGGGELEDQAAVHFLVEVEIEGIEALPLVAEGRGLDAALEQPVAPAQELVGHEGGEEVERGASLGLGLEPTGVEGGGHTGEAEAA